MASPSSRQNLIDYCLRQLGHPVLEINLDDDQIEDRIDEAFQFYREYHFDAIELTYVSIPMAQSLMTISGVNAAAFTAGCAVLLLLTGCRPGTRVDWPCCTGPWPRRCVGRPS